MRLPMFKNSRIYEGYIEAQLARWTADLEALKSKEGHLNIEAMAHHNDAVDALQLKHAEVSHHLVSLRGTSGEAWEKVKASTEKGWMEFKSAFQGSAARSLPASPVSKELHDLGHPNHLRGE
jgi:hypothetical protein